MYVCVGSYWTREGVIIGAASATGAGAGTAAGEAATSVLAAVISRPRGNRLLAIVVLTVRTRLERDVGHATRLCGSGKGRYIWRGFTGEESKNSAQDV